LGGSFVRCYLHLHIYQYPTRRYESLSAKSEAPRRLERSHCGGGHSRSKTPPLTFALMNLYLHRNRLAPQGA
jgi:hypothetical protein